MHVCLDTNIPFRFITQGKPGCEPEHWDALRSLVEDGHVTLLVPEVIVLELEKLYRDLEDDLALQFGKVEKAFGESAEKAKVWNEAADLVPFLKSQFVEWKKKKLHQASARHDEMQALLTSDRAVRLPFDDAVFFRAKRRLLAGRVANTDGKVEADCCILESVIRYFEGRGGDQLLFCSENWKDFGVEVEKGKYAFHPLMRDGLPPVELLTDLASLAAFLKEHKPVQEAAPAEVEKALERNKQEEIKEKIEAENLDRAVERIVEAVRQSGTLDYLRMPSGFDIMRQLAAKSAEKEGSIKRMGLAASIRPLVMPDFGVQAAKHLAASIRPPVMPDFGVQAAKHLAASIKPPYTADFGVQAAKHLAASIKPPYTADFAVQVAKHLGGITSRADTAQFAVPPRSRPEEAAQPASAGDPGGTEVISTDDVPPGDETTGEAGGKPTAPPESGDVGPQ